MGEKGSLCDFGGQVDASPVLLTETSAGLNPDPIRDPPPPSDRVGPGDPGHEERREVRGESLHGERTGRPNTQSFRRKAPALHEHIDDLG